MKGGSKHFYVKIKFIQNQYDVNHPVIFYLQKYTEISNIIASHV